MKPKGPAILIALGKAKGGKDDEGDDESMSDDEAGAEEKKQAGQAVLDAVKGDDPMAVYEAFEHLQNVCEEYGNDDSEKE